MKIYTVIHASDKDQISRNIDISIESGAHGTFVINHAGISIRSMIDAIAAEKKRNNFFIGINTLGVQSAEAFRLASDCNADALWLDESFDKIDQLAKSLYGGLYFGSVAFKTHEVVNDEQAELLAGLAKDYVDVAVTSGPSTGVSPSPNRISRMKKAIGNKPLGIASGISPENIHLFTDADVIMSATGISDSWTELSRKKALSR
jgi:predicted TIM-barrel enzyme